MEKMKDMGFGKTDKQLATTFGISVSDVKRIRAEVAKEISKPKPTSNPKTKKPMSYEDALKKYGNDVTKIPGNSRGKRVQ